MVTLIPWQGSRSGWWSWLAGWPSSLLRWWTFCSTKSILHLSILTPRDSEKGALFTILEEKKSSLVKKKVFSIIIVSFLFKLYLDKREDPEDINVKFTRNMKTSVDDITEEKRVLLEVPQQDQSGSWCRLFSDKFNVDFGINIDVWGYLEAFLASIWSILSDPFPR